MKKMDDEELQKWMEENRSAKKTDDLISDDAKAYQFLFDVLDTEPIQGLPYDFSAKVTRRVQAENKRSSELKYYLMSISVFTIAIAFIYGLLMLVKPGAATPYINLGLQYKWVFVLGILGILTIQYLDVVLVKGKVLKR